MSLSEYGGSITCQPRSRTSGGHPPPGEPRPAPHPSGHSRSWCRWQPGLSCRQCSTCTYQIDMLDPSGVRKGGAGLDLAIAVGVLVATGQLPPGCTESLSFCGELGLNGSLRHD